MTRVLRKVRTQGNQGQRDQISAEEALAQISDKNYTLPFEIEDQQIIRLGINFDSTTRNIDKVLVG